MLFFVLSVYLLWLEHSKDVYERMEDRALLIIMYCYCDNIQCSDKIVPKIKQNI